LLLSASPAFGQLFGFGIKGGVPMTDALNAATSQNFTFSTNTNRYVIGPMAELRLPFGFAVEANALYRHYSYTQSSLISGITTSLLNGSTTAGAWEFPLVAKYKFKAPIARPYVEAGIAWDKLSGLTQTITTTVAGIVHSSSSSNPAALQNNVTTGFVFGGGLDVKFLVIHVAPEIRITRWGDKHFVDAATGLLHSNLNQAEFLVGITF
jgi:hypothetical protein